MENTIITSPADLEKRNERRRFTFIVTLLSVDTLLIFAIIIILVIRG